MILFQMTSETEKSVSESTQLEWAVQKGEQQTQKCRLSGWEAYEKCIVQQGSNEPREVTYVGTDGLSEMDFTTGKELVQLAE